MSAENRTQGKKVVTVIIPVTTICCFNLITNAKHLSAAGSVHGFRSRSTVNSFCYECLTKVLRVSLGTNGQKTQNGLEGKNGHLSAFELPQITAWPCQTSSPGCKIGV